jgi:phage shock protein PspC (stress-responsive transcriptional regulator)
VVGEPFHFDAMMVMVMAMVLLLLSFVVIIVCWIILEIIVREKRKAAHC